MKIFDLVLRALLAKKSVVKTNLVDTKFKNVCFFSNTAIGDTLFNTPVWRAFKQHFSDVKSIVVLNPKNAALFKDDPHIDEVITYDGRTRGFFSTLSKLKKLDIDIVFILHSNEPQATPLAVLSGAKYVFKLPNASNEFRKFHSNSPSRCADLPDYVAYTRLKQLNFVGINSSDIALRLYLKDKDYQPADELLGRFEGKNIIGFQMGTNSLSRQYRPSKWLELARLFLKDDNNIIVLTGSSADKYLTASLCRATLNDSRVIDVAGKFELRQAAALIGRLDVLIVPDTGPLHIAAALKVPSVALFGVADSRATNPAFDADLHIALQAVKRDKQRVKKHANYFDLMDDISPQKIYDSAIKLLELKNNKI